MPLGHREAVMLECVTCLDCRYLNYRTGDPGYSEYTPGWDVSMSCNKAHWTYDAYNDELPQLRAKLYMARECKDFQVSEDL